LDGSQRDIFVQGPNVKLPNSIAIDWYTDEICWADAGLKSIGNFMNVLEIQMLLFKLYINKFIFVFIECVGIESRLQRTAVANCSYPFGLAITRDNYYWTDWIS